MENMDVLEGVHVTPNHSLTHGSPFSQFELFAQIGPLVAVYNDTSAWT